MKCNVCSNESANQILSLPKYPFNSIYLSKEDLNKKGKYDPRDYSVYMCETCGHIQATSAVELGELYNDDYNYNTQNSGVQGRILFFLSQLEKVEKTKFNRVIDIGCYNLSLLKVVKQKIEANYYIGVDPSIPDVCLANTDNIICFKDYIDNVELPYFDNALPDLIISDQTFEHIPTINSTLSNIIEKVSANSVFTICVPSVEVLIEKLNFHNLIHEHVNYFSINTLSKLFALNNATLRSYTLNYTSTCGFLFGIFIKNGPKSNEVLLGDNKIDKDYFFKHYDLFKDLLKLTNQIISELSNETIYGFGASDITPNLAYFMNSDFSFMKNILDETQYKQRRFFPNLKPEIIGLDLIEDSSKSYCLITAPQAARYIYANLNNLNFKKIINPIGLIS